MLLALALCAGSPAHALADRTGTDYRIVSFDRGAARTRVIFEGSGRDDRPVRVRIEA